MGAASRIPALFGIKTPNRSSKESAVPGVRSASGIQYMPDGAEGHFTDMYWSAEAYDPAPVVIYFSGSSFGNGMRGRGADLCRTIAKRRCIVLNPEFRVSKKNTDVREQLSDVMGLLRWISANASRYHMDTDRVMVTGSSYGALMAMWTALLCSSRRTIEAFGEEPPLKIKGIGLFNGMTDTESGDSVMREIAGSVRKLGKEDRELSECLRLWDNHDLRTLPPVFQVTGDLDSALPDTVKLGRLLSDNNVPHETMEYPPGEDTMSGFMEDHPSGNQCARTLSRMFSFIRDNQ